MKSRILLLIFLSLIISCHLYAQSWYEMMKDHRHHTFKEVCNAHDREELKEQKEQKEKNIFYAIANGGHLWKTINGGGSYISLTDQLPAMQIGKVQIDKANPNRIIFTQNKIRGIYQSLDGGSSWTIINAPNYLDGDII